MTMVEYAEQVEGGYSMAYSKFKNIAQNARAPQPIVDEAYIGFPHGLRTSVPKAMIRPTELAECINMQVNRGGQLQSRAGLRKLNTTSLGKIISLASCRIAGQVVNLAQTADFVIHRVLADGSSVVIGTAEDKADIKGYNGYAMIADGGYLKYIDDSLTIKLAWDGGSAYSATMFNNLSSAVTGSIDYTEAKEDKVTFTTPSWPDGLVLELTKIELKLGRAGTGGSAVLVVAVYRSSDDQLTAQSTLSADDITQLAPDPGDFHTFNLNTQQPVLPNTSYYVTLRRDTYDTTDYVKWYTTSGSSPLASVSPGLPPKGKHLLLHNRQLWLYGAEGKEGTLFYNNYSPFDWSTENFAGYLTTLDSDQATYPIGACVSYFGNMFVYGTQRWPYLLVLSGSGAQMNLIDQHQPLWSSPAMVTDVLNDMWSLNQGGVSSLTGVNMYGDVRTYSESFAIDDQIEKLWSEDSFAGYYVDRGQLIIAVGSKIFAGHTKAPTEGINRVRYPWTEYQFNFKPSCFGVWKDLVIGSEEGFIYEFASTYNADDNVPFYMSIKTMYHQSPFRYIDVLEAKVLVESRTGVRFEVVAYKDGNTFEEVNRWLLASALQDDVTIDDLGDALINNMDIQISPMSSPLVLRLGFRCFSYQIHLDNLKLLGAPLFIDGLVLRYRPMED